MAVAAVRPLPRRNGSTSARRPGRVSAPAFSIRTCRRGCVVTRAPCAVADRVLDEVRGQLREQGRVAADRRGLEPRVDRHVAGSASAIAARAIVARSTGSNAAVTALASARRSSASVSPIARALVSCRRSSSSLSWAGSARATSSSVAVDRQRRAQLVRRVGREALLARERVVEPVEHVVEVVGELLELVAAAAQADAVVEPAGGGEPRGRVDVVERAQDPAREQPAADEADHGERAPARTPST